MNQNEFDFNENKSSYTESYTPETPNFDVEDKGKRFADKIKAIFSSNAFLTATIAYTVLAGVSVIAGSIDIFGVLFAIGMWLAYSVSKKDTPIKEVKFLSGTLKAYYIVNIIAIVLLIVGAVLLIVFAPSVMDLDATIDSEFSSFISGMGGYENMFMEIEREDIDDLRYFQSMLGNRLQMSLADLLGILMIVIGVVFAISAVFCIIINEFFVKKLRKQLTNTIDALSANTETELKLGGIKIWFVVFGVFASISALSILLSAGPILAAGEAASAVACFALSSAITDR